MALLHSGIMGPVSGKVGNLVYYTSHGKCFVRRAPLKSKKRATLKQKIQRAKFGMVMRFISPLSHILNGSYKLIRRRKTRTNVLVRDILREGIIGQYPNFFIDYSRVNLLQGSLPWSGARIYHQQGSGSFDLRWTPLADVSRADDALIALIYCCDTKAWFMVEEGVRRMEGSCSFQMDSALDGRRLQVWIAFRSADQRAYSNTEFMGEIITSKTSLYEN